MISCITFKKHIDDFIDGSITDDLKAAIEEHIQNCESCHILYEEELQIESAFKDVVNIRNINFNSSRNEILRGIDKKRYSKSFSNKLHYRIKKNILTYAASVLLIFSITSGSFYFYNSYMNKLNKPTSLKKDYSYLESVKPDTINKIVEPKISNQDNNLIERELPLPNRSNNKGLQELLNKIKTEPQGSEPWILGYTDNNKIIFHNNSALLAYSYNNGSPKYYAGIDLNKIDAVYTQGSIHTDFNFSPNGDYAIINNGYNENDIQKSKYNMYLYNLKNGALNIISNENKFLIKDTWSSTSNFYAFADRNGERVFVYDIASASGITLPFSKGSINNIFISDYGDIIIESTPNNGDNRGHEKYILKKDNSYQLEEYFIPGFIIRMKGNSVLYYDQDTVYELVEGKSSAVKKLGPGFNIQSLQKKYASFTDGVSTYIYDYGNNFYRYASLYGQNDNIEFSPDLKKYALIRGNGAKIISSDNIHEEIDIGYFNHSSSNYAWFGNNSMVRISKNDNTSALDSFSLYKANIIPGNGTKNIPRDKNVQKEQYAKGVLIDNTNTSSLDAANIITTNYLEQMKGEEISNTFRIKDYKIKVIRVLKQSKDSLLFSVQYSLLPYGNYSQSLGKSRDDEGWYNNIFTSISAYAEDNIYYINGVSQNRD